MRMEFLVLLGNSILTDLCGLNSNIGVQWHEPKNDIGVVVRRATKVMDPNLGLYIGYLP
jgi:hypothetical protein